MIPAGNDCPGHISKYAVKRSSFSHYSVTLCIAKAFTSKEADLFRDQLLILELV